MSSKSKKITKNISRNSGSVDIKIKELKHQKRTDLHESFLELEFTGSDINNIFVNTMRRVSMDEIPIYAFPSELIKIEGNTSIFNNDYMKLRLSQIPIYDCDSGLEYLDNKYLNMGLNFDDTHFLKYEKEKVIEMYINSYNNTPENINVTTNDVKYIEDGEPVEKYSKKFPILITQLRPNETFKAHMKAALSTGIKSNIFSASSNTFYDNEDDKITFRIESQGQIDEYLILEKSCNFILKKLNDFEKSFTQQLKENKKYEKNSTLLLEFENEDHTMGELLNTVFQDHDKIVFSGMSKPSPLERLIKIKIVSSDDHPMVYMLEQIEYLKSVYETILNQLKKLSK